MELRGKLVLASSQRGTSNKRICPSAALPLLKCAQKKTVHGYLPSAEAIAGNARPGSSLGRAREVLHSRANTKSVASGRNLYNEDSNQEPGLNTEPNEADSACVETEKVRAQETDMKLEPERR